jgi:hypothetical protein
MSDDDLVWSEMAGTNQVGEPDWFKVRYKTIRVMATIHGQLHGLEAVVDLNEPEAERVVRSALEQEIWKAML